MLPIKSLCTADRARPPAVPNVTHTPVSGATGKSGQSPNFTAVLQVLRQRGGTVRQVDTGYSGNEHVIGAVILGGRTHAR